MLARVIATTVALALVASAPAEAQLGRLKEKVKQRAEAAVDKATDKALDKAEATVKCVATDTACADKAKAEGKQVEIISEGSSGFSRSGKGPVAATGGAGSASAPGRGVWENFDFVPGERVLFAEDFTRDRVGNFPKRLEMSTGNIQVVEWNGSRWLKLEAISDAATFSVPLPEKLPPRFTIEFDAVLNWDGFGFYSAPEPVGTYGRQARPMPFVFLSLHGAGVYRANPNVRSSSNPAATEFSPKDVLKDLAGAESNTSRPVRVRLHVDGRYVKLYLDERRVANVPNLDFGRANNLVFTADAHHDRPAVMLANVSVNAGGKELYDALMSDGRMALQGIYFDTGSDRIRPESSGQLAEIAEMLKSHADLKVVIEGHTDNVGDAAANQTLSEKRAAAVKAALSTTYGIDASRLSSKGLGASKPAAPNTTPEGRQQNRRVELVKG